ncbi:MAG: acylphosphatase, partial [bacterium]
MKQVHVYIKGDVIGVGFRAWTKIQAKIIGVNGWVRNVFEHPNKFG